MPRYSFHLFAADAHIGETFDDLEGAAHYLLAWAKANASMAATEGLYIQIKPYYSKEDE